MKSLVFVKQVPDSTADMKTEGVNVSWGDAPLVINPWDEIAVEAALQVQEEHGGDVLAVCMGKEGDTEALKHAIAMGCEEAVLISYPGLAGADSLAVAHALAAAVKKAGDVNIAFFGRQAIDSEAGVTAAQTARLLGWPILSLVSEIQSLDVDKGSLRIARTTEEGKQIVDVKLPAVLTFGRDFGEPRYPSFIRKRKAAKAEIPVWSMADLGIQAVSPSVTWSDAKTVPPREVEVEMITGSNSEEIAGKLADRLIEEKVL